MSAVPRLARKPSRIFASQAVHGRASAPEELTASQRRRLSPAALRERQKVESAYVHGLYVPTAQQRHCEDRVAAYLDMARYGLPGPKDSLYILGQPGTGKSTAVYQASLRFHRDRLVDEGLEGQADPRWEDVGLVSDFVPAVFVTLRSDARNRAIVAQIIDFLGYRSTASAASMTDDMQVLATRHGIALVVTDDVANVADLGKDRDRIHNLIKNLNTEFGMVSVCSIYIGNPDASGGGNLFGNRQLYQRLTPLWMTDMNFDLRAASSDANVAWARYLLEWEAALRPVLPDLEGDDLAVRLGRRLWARTQGSVGGLASLLKLGTTDLLRGDTSGVRLTMTRDRVESTELPERFRRSTR